MLYNRKGWNNSRVLGVLKKKKKEEENIASELQWRTNPYT